MNTPNYTSKEYDKHIKQINTVNDVYDGIDTAAKHLKQFAQETENDFKYRKADATLDNFVYRTVEAVKGIVFRKPIDITGVVNPIMQDYMLSIDKTNDIDNFAKTVLKNRIKEGYTFILADSLSYSDEEILTKADQDEAGIRPYLTNILRKNVINWEMDASDNYIRVTIKETYTENKGRYGSEEKEQIRVIFADGTIEIWRESGLYKVIENLPYENGIPLIKIGDDEVPNLYDQSKINIVHLNRNSELDNYTRVGAAPFPITYGMLSDQDAPKTLGINSGLSFQDKQSGGFEWGEMSGSNSGIIQERINYHEEQMERISVEFVTDIMGKTATEVQKASTGKESKLRNYSDELEEGINKSLENLSLFQEGLGENVIATNKDFDSNIITLEQFNMIMQLRTQGDISRDLLLEMLMNGELIPLLDDAGKQDEATRLRDEGEIE